MKNKYREAKGCLISMALNGEFDVIAHGCNCFCTQGAGIAKQMSKTFHTSLFIKEQLHFKGNINKLGIIEYISTKDISRMFADNILHNFGS